MAELMCFTGGGRGGALLPAKHLAAYLAVFAAGPWPAMNKKGTCEALSCK